MPDGQLEKKLAKQVAYDRVGYSDNAFNYIALDVKDGVVTLTGDAVWDVPRDSALAIVARTPGVKDVVNDVNVLPTSRFDDSIRQRTARAIYRDSVLGRYASDPVNPIRIVVDNGHVTLYGTVESSDGQDHRRNTSQFRTGRVQRRQQVGGGLTCGGINSWWLGARREPRPFFIAPFDDSCSHWL